jgi:hypothetical protein
MEMARIAAHEFSGHSRLLFATSAFVDVVVGMDEKLTVLASSVEPRRRRASRRVPTSEASSRQ